MIEAFRQAIVDSGLTPPENIDADGRLHRFPSNGKASDAAGWYVLHDDGLAAGAFGCWRAGISERWHGHIEGLSDTERTQQRQRIEKARAEAERERLAEQAKAKDRARDIWTLAEAAPPDHPYLKRKGVKSYGLRVSDGNLVIPMREGNELHSLQFIAENGHKRFLTGGRVKGCYFAMGTPDRVLYVCEGCATGASIHEATGHAVAVAFFANNLQAVAILLRRKYPKVRIVIAGDNDETEVGQRAALQVAQAVNGVSVIPQEVGDWNDYAAAHGPDVLRAEIEKGHYTPSAVTATSKDRAWNTADRQSVPSGYSCQDDGVRFIGDDPEKPILITHRRVWVEALSCDGDRENWGRLICWQDHDGEYHERAVKAGRLHTQGSELASELADAGLSIVPGREKHLLRYLADFNPKRRMVAVTSTGWFNDVFMLPKQIIGESPDERIVFQPPAYHAAADAIYAKGTLAEWQKYIAQPSAKNPLLRFAISSALAAPLRYQAGIEAGGSHFYGQTSWGKTTLLQVAGSVFGNSADPAQVGGDNAYLRRWNMTSNAMEGIAEAYNDLPLIIDEIGEGDEQSFGKAIYRFMGGTGRERLDRTGAARKHRSWRGWLLSAGEIPVSQHIDAGGHKARGGQLVRLIDIPVDSIFDDAASADQMKEACGRYFGTSGPAFIETLITDLESLRQALRSLDEIAEKIGEARSVEEKRVRKRFALSAVAGEMAITASILPWAKGAALKACQHTYGLWKQDNTLVSDANRGIVNIRNFIFKHGSSRFEREQDRTFMVYNRAGWYRDSMYHFTPEAFREACGGVLETVVKKALSKGGLLHTSDAPGRLRSSIRVDGTPTHVVSVREAILNDAEPTEPTLNAGAGSPGTPRNTGTEPAEPAEPSQVNNARSGVQSA